VFLEFGSGSESTFLETPQGEKYKMVFAKLRYEHIIIDLTSTKLLNKDRIIPKGKTKINYYLPVTKNCVKTSLQDCDSTSDCSCDYYLSQLLPLSC